ncbi:hypothetical protein [Streptomyces sparsogenes]|uniref:hypothetical protein n=1 Tax=Streptomyces sparsogenes TaxID=67365 RepID=UPI0014739134|nr:hypothetical protein [Streptomyces sparsogenes]
MGTPSLADADADADAVTLGRSGVVARYALDLSPGTLAVTAVRGIPHAQDASIYR